MTALEAVSVYLPPVRKSVESLAGPLGLTDIQVKLFRRFHGLREVGRDPDASLSALLMKATAGLDALRGQEHRVRYVLYARTMPVVGPYPVNPLHDVCRALGLGHALAFTVTHQSCASGLLAIDMTDRVMGTAAARTASSAPTIRRAARPLGSSASEPPIPLAETRTALGIGTRLPSRPRQGTTRPCPSRSSTLR